MSNKTLKKLTVDVNRELQIKVSVDDFVKAYGEYVKKIYTQNLITSLETQFQSCMNCKDSVLIGFNDISFGFDDVEPEAFEEMCRTLIDEKS